MGLVRGYHRKDGSYVSSHSRISKRNTTWYDYKPPGNDENPDPEKKPVGWGQTVITIIVLFIIYKSCA